jgi:hypothetical protein
MLPADTDAPLRWPVPELPSGGPDAAREVAATCERLATLLWSTTATIEGVRQLCAANRGRAGDAIDHTLTELQRTHETVAHNLAGSAQAMRKFADEMEAAHRQHHWSLHKIVKLGAIVVVGAGVVWVTAGTAAPAAAAAVGAEVAVADAAAAAAAAAGESAAAEFAVLARAFSAVRGLASISRVQLVYGEVWMTAQSLRSEMLQDRVIPSTSPRALALDAAGMAFGAGAGKIAALALAGRTGMAVTVASTGASAVGGAVPQTAYDWERTGSFPARSFAWNAAKGAGSSVISGNSKKLITKFDKWKATHHPRPAPGRHRAGRHRPAE